MDTLKDYREALYIVESEGTPGSKYNKLLKIMIRTEDSQLKKLVGEMAEAYKDYLKPGMTRSINSNLPRNNRESINFIKNRKTELISYINSILNMQKPQWQIIAERNGWIAPNREGLASGM